MKEHILHTCGRGGQVPHCTPSTLRIKTPIATQAHTEHCAAINCNVGEDFFFFLTLVSI